MPPLYERIAIQIKRARCVGTKPGVAPVRAERESKAGQAKGGEPGEGCDRLLEDLYLALERIVGMVLDLGFVLDDLTVDLVGQQIDGGV